jgi:hypothetical protein
MMGLLTAAMQSYIAQKRHEKMCTQREAKEEAGAVHHRTLGMRRLTSENARQVCVCESMRGSGVNCKCVSKCIEVRGRYLQDEENDYIHEA